MVNGGQVHAQENGWRLELPAGDANQYRLAQLDDYHGRARRTFPHHPPLAIQVHMRASQPVIPGTWGIGLWNDPFSLWLSGPPDRWRFPTLPQAAWFFFASPPNHLTFHDHLPGAGLLASTFAASRRSRLWAWAVLPALPAAWTPGIRRLARRLAARWIAQDTALLPIDPSTWHAYRLLWETGRVRFWVDEQLVLDTSCAPHPPLGLVLWVDNQYAAWKPGERPRMGQLANNRPVWIEVRDMQVNPYR